LGESFLLFFLLHLRIFTSLLGQNQQHDKPRIH